MMHFKNFEFNQHCLQDFWIKTLPADQKGLTRSCIEKIREMSSRGFLAGKDRHSLWFRPFLDV